jgi:hypothetical protein
VGKLRSSRLLPHIIVFIATISLVHMEPISAVSANSAPPPSVAWFTFVDQTGQSPRLEGVQLIACDTADCQQPVLLQQFGACDGSECIKSTPTLSGWSTALDCAVGICRSSAYPNHGGTSFRLVAKFSDGTRTSDTVGTLPSKYAEVAAWQVLVNTANLSIVQDPRVPSIDNTIRLIPQNFKWIVISIIAELLVAAACFQLLAKTDTHQLLRRLLIVFLVNLVSLAMVWLYFPSLGHFQSAGSRDFGLFILILTGLFSGLLIAIYRSTGRAHGWAIALASIALILTVLSYGIIRSFIWYAGGYTVYVQGLSSTAIIIVSEVFAVTFEALMIAILTKTSISTRFIWLTSLLMNSTSFLLGLFLMSQ